MKQLLFLIILLAVLKNSFCQINLNGTEERTFVLSVGAEKMFINNEAFNNWTEQNYNKKINNFASLNLDVNMILKAYDVGIDASVGYPYAVGSIYWGRRLTSLQSKVSSFLNLHIGFFDALPDVAPVNYVPTPDQQGKHLQLQYHETYIGLSDKNYLNKLNFRTGKGKKAVSYNPGFYFDFGYEPWNGDWQYGYYKGSGKYSQFIGNKVYGIPNLSKIFFTTGIFIGIGN
jgi:hypothetical protein